MAICVAVIGTYGNLIKLKQLERDKMVIEKRLEGDCDAIETNWKV